MIRNLGELGVNLQKIITRLMANQQLLKLLYYTDKDPLSGENLTKQQIENEIYEKLIKVVPRVGPKDGSHSLLAFQVVRGYTNPENDEFQNLVVQIEVFVPMTQWLIKDSNLRPFAIMSEVQKSLSNKIINGLGRLEYSGFEINFLTDEMSCYEMTFRLTEYE